VVLAIVLICLAVALGLGGLLLEGVKWLLIIAVVLLIAGFISAALGRRRNRQL
jgi:general stress protein CsbA